MSAEVEYRTVTLPDGRAAELALAGFDTAAADAPAVVFHHGTPQARESYAPVVDAVVSRGWRWVSRTRPGYAGSTRRPGRSVADDTADVVAVLDLLGVDRFVAMGWSGGGPHALACGALLAPRCAAVACLAGVGPFGGSADAPLDFLAGMGPENVEEYTAVQESEAALRAWLAPFAGELAGIDAAGVTEALGGLVDAPDKAVLAAGYDAAIAAGFREALSTGVDGWVDDDLAFVAPWGFDVAAITVPVSVWQGTEDRMVPFAHGEWLAARIPAARAHLLPGEGHLSVAVGRFDEIVEEVLDLAR